MPKIYGKRYSRAELMARVGDVSQIARIKPYRLIEGAEEGVMAIDVTTGSGLTFTILPGRGMDISAASYCGCALGWRSSTTDRHPTFFDHEGENGRGWLRSFAGGLVTTCGLSYAGAAGNDGDQGYGLHGRISNLPAYSVAWEGHWDGDEYNLTISGKVRETTVFGENLELHRKITTQLGSTCLTINDTVENLGHHPAEHMMLYHINIGFPVVDETARLISPTLSVTCRDEEAQNGQEKYAQLQAPETGYREKVYFHELANNNGQRVTNAIVNSSIAASTTPEKTLGVYCTHDPVQLPRFIEWKMMASGTYVVGMEPANCLVMGRDQERKTGTLQILAPGESRKYDLEIGVLTTPAEIEELEIASRNAIANAKLQQVGT